MRGRLLPILLVAGLLAVPAFAAVEEVRLQVKGLACPFCTYGIEKNLKKLPGVVSVETTIRTGVVRIKVAPGTALDVEGFKRAVIDSGFTFEHLEATVTGKLVRRDGRPALGTGSGRQVFLLVEASPEGVSEELSRGTLERLEKASGNGSHMLTVIGRVHGHVGMPPALSVQSFEAAK